MGVVVARREVRAGEAAERKLAAVGAATHGDAAHLFADGRVGRAGVVDEVGVLGARDHVGEVVVLVGDLDLEHALPHLGVHHLHGGAHLVLAALDLGLVMVADDVVGRGLLAVAAHALKVKEAVVAVGELRALGRRQHLVEAHNGLGGVDHHALGRARVARKAVRADLGLGRVERLVAELSERAAVDGVAELGPELLEVEKRRAVPDLLVRHEREREARVRKRRVGLQARKERHNHGVAGLVVAAEKRGAVGGHDVVAGHLREARVRLRGDGDLAPVAPGADDELAALVVLDLGMHGRPVALPRRVDVAAEPQARQVLGAGGGGPVGGHVGVLVDLDVLGAELAQVGRDDVRDVELRLGRGHVVGRQRVRLRRHLAVADKAIKNIRHAVHPSFHEDVWNPDSMINLSTRTRPRGVDRRGAQLRCSAKKTGGRSRGPTPRRSRSPRARARRPSTPRQRGGRRTCGRA